MRPVVEEVLQQDAFACFEIIGDAKVKKLYRGLARVNIVSPMSWDAYLHFTSMPGRHVGLAPLLDARFNQARSCTKYFDITRCGAIGIYAAESICSDWIQDGENGYLLPMSQDLWSNKSLELFGVREG